MRKILLICSFDQFFCTRTTWCWIKQDARVSVQLLASKWDLGLALLLRHKVGELFHPQFPRLRIITWQSAAAPICWRSERWIIVGLDGSRRTWKFSNLVCFCPTASFFKGAGFCLSLSLRFDRLVDAFLPKLGHFFQEHGITSEYYAIQWSADCASSVAWLLGARDQEYTECW